VSPKLSPIPSCHPQRSISHQGKISQQKVQAARRGTSIPWHAARKQYMLTGPGLVWTPSTAHRSSSRFSQCYRLCIPEDTGSSQHINLQGIASLCRVLTHGGRIRGLPPSRSAPTVQENAGGRMSFNCIQSPQHYRVTVSGCYLSYGWAKGFAPARSTLPFRHTAHLATASLGV